MYAVLWVGGIAAGYAIGASGRGFLQGAVVAVLMGIVGALIVLLPAWDLMIVNREVLAIRNYLKWNVIEWAEVREVKPGLDGVVTFHLRDGRTIGARVTRRNQVPFTRRFDAPLVEELRDRLVKP